MTRFPTRPPILGLERDIRGEYPIREAQTATASRSRKIEALEPDLQDLPEPETPEAEGASEDWLFESGREYREQLDHYNRDDEDE